MVTQDEIDRWRKQLADGDRAEIAKRPEFIEFARRYREAGHRVPL